MTMTIFTSESRGPAFDRPFRLTFGKPGDFVQFGTICEASYTWQLSLFLVTFNPNILRAKGLSLLMSQRCVPLMNMNSHTEYSGQENWNILQDQATSLTKPITSHGLRRYRPATVDKAKIAWNLQSRFKKLHIIQVSTCPCIQTEADTQEEQHLSDRPRRQIRSIELNSSQGWDLQSPHETSPKRGNPTVRN